MSHKDFVDMVTELKELCAMQDELAVEIEALRDKIKEHMDEQGVDELGAGMFKVSWKAVTSSRIDTSALKKAMPELAERFTKMTTIRRFTVS